MRLLLRGLFGGLVIVLLGAGPAFAQAGATAQITGVVADESGGVLPGVTVTAIQTETGFRREAVTDTDGAYTLPNLQIGPYRLEAALAGFRSFQRTGIVLQVNANPAINVTLSIGNLSETVSVEAAAPLVETRSASIGTVIENERIEELPLNGRNVTQLIVLAGAAVQGAGATSRSMQGGSGIAVAGGQSFGVAYQLDGALHNNPYDNLNLPLPFPDALQEFRLETSSTTANNGMHSGASVNAVTKSGTNLLHGDLFEFVRDHRFNATDPFARVDPATGERVSDGLNRNQFGGTIGGPILTDRMFFFGAYQGTRLRQQPADLFRFIPTEQMLQGDFTTLASAQCNATGALTLRGPIVGNRINPSGLSPAAVNISRRLLATGLQPDQCGRVEYSQTRPEDEAQYIGKYDLQISNNHSLFARYMFTTAKATPPMELQPDNLLVSTTGGRDNKAHSLTIGDTMVLSNTMVNSLRFAWNFTDIHRTNVPLGFDVRDVGINAFSYIEDYMLLSITGGFNLGGGTESEARFKTPSYAINDDLTIVRGNHQFGFGGSLAYWTSLSQANVRSPGQYTFNGSRTGHGLADFLTGQLASLIQAVPNTLDMHQWYAGLYAQDSWKLTPTMTVNYGVRWEPGIAQQIQNGAIYNFSLDRYLRRERSTQFANAPPGFLYPGDPGFVNGQAGMQNNWMQFSPRAGFAWDVHGDGRMAVRGGYSLAYDFINAQFHLNTSVAPPWGAEARVNNPAGGFDNPWAGTGQETFFPYQLGPNAPFPLTGPYIAIPSDIKPPRQQSWNLGVQQQIGSNLAVGVSYIGTYQDRGWNVMSLNPSVYIPGSCTLTNNSGVPQFFADCSGTNSAANVDLRRRLTMADPVWGRYLGAVDLHTALAEQRYNGLLLSVNRRAANGLNIGANYTVSKCMGHPNQGGSTPNVNSGYTNPDDIDYDYGACDTDRRHIFNLTFTASAPEFDGRAMRLAFSGWRASAIYRLQSGSPLTVTVNDDPARTGIGGQRANAVLDDPYGAKTLSSYLNPAAFSRPALGTYGNQERGWFTGPGSRNVDFSLVRSFRFAATHRIEARVESFNVFNWMRWGNPTTGLNNTQTFGRITNAAEPRIMQFALKYSF
jgi:hypothetical protein